VLNSIRSVTLGAVSSGMVLTPILQRNGHPS
jgi:hypothetical protein